MPNVTLQHPDLLPMWLRSMLFYTSGLWVLVSMGTSMLKRLQQPQVRAALRHAPPAIKLIGAKIRELLADPYEYPNIARVLEYGALASFYALASIHFIDFVVLLWLLAITPKHLSWLQQVAIICFSLVCAFVGALLKAQAGRCRSKLRGSVAST
jgi:hypothetical protein